MKALILSLGILSVVLGSSSSLALAQAGCSDAGVCTLGGHSTELLDRTEKLSVGFSQTFGLGHHFAYFETVPKIGYDFDVFKAELSVNYRVASATEVHIAEPVVVEVRKPGKLPSIQHVTIENNTISTHYALGDAKLRIAIPIKEVDKRLSLDLGYMHPLTKLYEDRPQEMQSTLGLPSLLAGLSFDDASESVDYGGTLGYQTTFGAQNALHMIRADDLALTGRMSGSISNSFDAGLDLSVIDHLDDDKLHGSPTSKIQGYESTQGLTINLGGSITARPSPHTSLGLYLAAPIVSREHVDGLDRKFVAGLVLAASW